MGKIAKLVRERIANRLFVEWLKRSGGSEAVWDRFDEGIPERWADVLAEVFPEEAPFDVWPNVIHDPRVLHNRLQRARVSGDNMNAAHRLAISSGAKADPFLEAIRNAKPKGFTQNSLAKRLGISPTLMSLYRKGDRPIPRARAQRIETLTGYEATAGNWRGGIVEND